MKEHTCVLGELVCGESAFTAITISDRHGCKRCARRIEALVRAVVKLANCGMADSLLAHDPALARLVEWATRLVREADYSLEAEASSVAGKS